MNFRIQTLEDFNAHDGLHYKNLWKETPSLWECPGCGRNKYKIMRWTKRFPNSEKSFMGWVAALHRHHDHGVPTRFERQVICDQCNSSDGAVKRKFKLPENFSFSPQEMRTFINPTNHGKHEIDYDRAKQIFDYFSNCIRE